jgi:hypothetical protein
VADDYWRRPAIVRIRETCRPASTSRVEVYTSNVRRTLHGKWALRRRESVFHVDALAATA